MYRDPVTGDELTRLEYFVRKVQVFVRTPWFIVAFNVITLLMIFILGMPLQWNDLASWLAIIIEWLVGTYMFGQTGRDAVHIRKIAHLEEMNVTQLKHLETLVANQTPRSDDSGNGQAGLHREDAETSERATSPSASDAG